MIRQELKSSIGNLAFLALLITSFMLSGTYEILGQNNKPELLEEIQTTYGHTQSTQSLCEFQVTNN